MKKDHIALPASTLKRFREHGEKDLFYLDLNNGQIRKKGPSIYQKQYGYYQKDFDDVCQSIETRMGKIHENIDILYKSHGGDFYSSEYLKSISIDILALQTVRRPELLENVTKPDVALKKIDKIMVSHAVTGKLTPKAVDTAHMFRRVFSTQKNRRDFFYNTSFEETRKIFVDAGQIQNYTAIIHAIPDTIIPIKY